MIERIRETGGPVAAAVRAMYAGYGDPGRFDAHLHPDITIWETDQPGPPIGLAQLDALRDRRAPDQGTSDRARPVLSVHDLLVDRWGGTAAVARYLLRGDLPGSRTEFRATDVFTGTEGSWRIVHHHAEQIVRSSGQ